MGSFSVWHWLVVLAVLVLLFGSKRLPDAARGLGRSLRILKSEVRQMNSEDDSESSKTPSAASSTSPKVATETAAISAAPSQSGHEQPSHVTSA